MSKDIRLPTKAEKEYILDFCKNTGNRPLFIKRPVIFTMAFIAFAAFFGVFFGWLDHKLLTGILAFTISFAAMMFIVLSQIIPMMNGYKALPEMIANDQLYVQEATYHETITKGYMIFVTRRVNGKTKYGNVDILKCETFEMNEKIIILQMRGRKWAFKARKYDHKISG